MSYATQADLEDTFGATEVLQLADRDQDEVIDTESSKPPWRAPTA